MGSRTLNERIVQLVERRRDPTIHFLKELCSVPSYIDLEKKTGYELEAQNCVKDKLGGMGFDLQIFEPDPEELKHFGTAYIPGFEYKNRPNVVGTLKGEGGGRSLILNGHVDVVTAEPSSAWKHDPFGGEIEGERMYGRGTADMKGGITAMISALDAILEAGAKLKGDVIFQSVVSEEDTNNGTLACVAKGHRADAAIVAEPTELGVHIGHPGSMHLNIKVKGKSGHQAMKYECINAIEKMTSIINIMNEINQEWVKTKGMKYFPKPGINVGVIKGGESVYIVPEECSLEALVDYLPNEIDPDGRGGRVRQQVEERVTEGLKNDPWLSNNYPVISWPFDWDPCVISEDAPIVKAMTAATERVLGRSGVGVLPSVCDLMHLVNRARIPSIAYGPGSIIQAHAIDEFISINQLIDATKVFALAITEWCGLVE